MKAVKAKDKEKVRSLQRLLARSLAGRLKAVRRVTTNRGKRTPGVDKILLDTPAKKWQQAQSLNVTGYKAQPLKRTYVSKKNSKMRPLGIPVMHDRAEQSLEQMGLDPVSECTADSHSYGFRKKRSIHDAIGACYNALRRQGSACQWTPSFTKLVDIKFYDSCPFVSARLEGARRATGDRAGPNVSSYFRDLGAGMSDL